MLILEDISAEIPDTNAYHWNLKDLSNHSEDSVLMYGYNSSYNPSYHSRCRNFTRKAFFNNWAPCEFAQHKDHNNKTAINYDDFFTEIYSICPYTSKWLNALGSKKVYKSIFYPFNKHIIPENFEKKYDVIYHGGIHGQEHYNCLLTMKDFNYRYVTMTRHINRMTQQCLSFATDVDLSFREKINLVAKSKMSVCYNFVHIAPSHLPVIKSFSRWKDNEAFSEVERWNIMPQFKTRAHEAAISKTLNLVQKDPWNVIEKYYEPEKEFVYFENESDLRNKIKDITHNWSDYQHIVERAYTKAMNYTTENFVKVVKSGEEWK